MPELPLYDPRRRRVLGSVSDWLIHHRIERWDIRQCAIAAERTPEFAELLTVVKPYSPKGGAPGTLAFKMPSPLTTLCGVGRSHAYKFFVLANGNIAWAREYFFMPDRHGPVLQIILRHDGGFDTRHFVLVDEPPHIELHNRLDVVRTYSVTCKRLFEYITGVTHGEGRSWAQQLETDRLLFDEITRYLESKK